MVSFSEDPSSSMSATLKSQVDQVTLIYLNISIQNKNSIESYATQRAWARSIGPEKQNIQSRNCNNDFLLSPHLSQLVIKAIPKIAIHHFGSSIRNSLCCLNKTETEHLKFVLCFKISKGMSVKRCRNQQRSRLMGRRPFGWIFDRSEVKLIKLTLIKPIFKTDIFLFSSLAQGPLGPGPLAFRTQGHFRALNYKGFSWKNWLAQAYLIW